MQQHHSGMERCKPELPDWVRSSGHWGQIAISQAQAILLPLTFWGSEPPCPAVKPASPAIFPILYLHKEQQPPCFTCSHLNPALICLSVFDESKPSKNIFNFSQASDSVLGFLLAQTFWVLSSESCPSCEPSTVWVLAECVCQVCLEPVAWMVITSRRGLWGGPCKDYRQISRFIKTGRRGRKWDQPESHRFCFSCEWGIDGENYHYPCSNYDYWKFTCNKLRF